MRYSLASVLTITLALYACSGEESPEIPAELPNSSSETSTQQTSSSQPITSTSAINSSSSLASAGSSSSSAVNRPPQQSLEPPFSGTAFIDNDIFNQSDPTVFKTLNYAGQNNREVYDSRSEPKKTVQSMYIFRAQFTDRGDVELQLDPKFDTQKAAQDLAQTIAEALGRIPFQLRSNVDFISVFKGDGRANASSKNKTIRLYSSTPEARYEELLVHEAAHVSLDPLWRNHNEWLQAQSQDPGFISTYARDKFSTEDIAESVLPYIALRYKAGRIDKDNERKMQRINPYRIAFFDRYFTDLHPMKNIKNDIKGRLIAPSTQETLKSDSVRFEWDRPNGAQNFDLVLGNQGYGSNNIRPSSTLNNTTLDIEGLPSDGSALFARLWTYNNNEWRYDDYRFSGYSPNINTAIIHTPVNGSNLYDEEITFRWDAPTYAKKFDLIIGTQGAGSDDVRQSQSFTQSFIRVTNLPSNNETLYVRLRTFTDEWHYQDFEYKAKQTRAVLISPQPNTELQPGNINFIWDKPKGSTNYDLLVGTTGPASSDLRATKPLKENTLTLNNIANGQTLYVRLWTNNNGWVYQDYVFNVK